MVIPSFITGVAIAILIAAKLVPSLVIALSFNCKAVVGIKRPSAKESPTTIVYLNTKFDGVLLLSS